MADAFRGLTLRIGADARPVKSALDSISRSAGQTQKQLNKMSKALKFDGNNLGALRQAMSLADDKAAHMAMSMRTAATAMKQAASQSAGFGEHSKYFGQNIAQAARSIKNVNSHIQQTREQAKTTNAQLQHIYDSAKKIVESRLYAPFATAEQKAKLADDVIKQIQQDLMSMGPKADSAFDAMRKFITEATTNKKMNLSEKFGLGKTEDDAEKLFETFKRLREKSSEFDKDLKALKSVGGFQALKTEVLAYESSLREAAAETTRYKAELYSIGAAPGLSRALSEIKGIKSATQAATEQARIMDDAYKAAPRSIDMARGKLIAAKNAQQALTEQIKQMRAAMRKIESSDGFDKLAAQSGNVHLEFDKAKSAATEAAAAVQRVESRIKELNHQKLAFIGPQSEGDLKELDAQIDKLNADLAVMKARASSADEALEAAAAHNQYAQLAADIAKANTELAELKMRSSGFNAIKNFGAGLREVGYGLYSTVTPALMMAGRYAIQAAEDIDSAYRDMRKTVNGTEEQFEHLKQAALDYSTTHVTSADQILEIEAMGGQLGIAADDLEAFATTISNLDIATNINADEAAEQLGKMASVLGLSADEYDNFGDALVRLGNNMPVMESDIMTLTTRYMGMGKVVGMSADEMLAWSAAASATGQKSEAAGSSMQRFISNVETAVTAGGDELEMFAKIAGMTSQEFVDKFGHDASGAMRDFVAGLGEMQKNGESVNQALKDLGINNVRDKQLLEGLANQMANTTGEASILDQALRMSSDAWNGLSTDLGKNGIEQAGDAAREAAKKAEGFSGSLQMMKNQAQVLGATLADSAAPFLRDLGVLLADLTDRFRSLPDGMKELTLKALALTAALGPIGVFTGTVIRSGASVVSAFFNVGKAVGMAGIKLKDWGSLATGAALESEKGLMRAGKAATGLGKALGFLSSAGGFIAITGVATALKLIADRFQEAADNSAAYKKATEEVAKASNESIRIWRQDSDAFDEFAGKPQSAALSYQELVDAQGKLVDSINERNAAAQTEISTLNGAEDALTRYLNKTGLTVTEQQKLKAAVELLNEKYNQNLSIVDLENGKIADNTGAILNNADAVRKLIEEKKLAARVDVLAANLAEQQVAADNAAASYAKAAKEYQAFENFAENMDPTTFTVWGDLSGTVSEIGSQLKGTMDAEKEMLDTTQSAANATETQLNSLAGSVGNASDSIASLVKNQGAVLTFFGNDTVSLQKFASEIEKCGLSVEDFYDVSSSTWAEILAKWSDGGKDMSSILSELGVGIHTTGWQFAQAFENAGGYADDLYEKANQVSGGIEQFAESLVGAGIGAQEFADMGIAGFDELYAAAEGDFANLGALLDALNAQKIDPKDIHVNGDEITTATGDVYTLESAADAVGSKTYTVTLKAEAAQAQGNVESAQATADTWGASHETAVIDEEGAEESEDAADSAREAAENYEGNYSATLSADASSAWSTLNEINDALDAFGRRHETATVSVSEGGNAMGGILARYNASGALASRLIRAIPRHADGGLNGIVTRPTMTNIGWVGEAGAEAVMHMKNAGGAVVPLTNRRYVRPFARAVASEMSGGRTVNVSVNLNYQAGDDATKLARDVTNRIEAYLAMGA